jgi:heme/copper-type cytochrome/quinol oxidase subunit 2
VMVMVMVMVMVIVTVIVIVLVIVMVYAGLTSAPRKQAPQVALSSVHVPTLRPLPAFCLIHR